MEPQQRESWDVFIAHAGADLGPAKELAAALLTEKLNYFLDAARLRAGDSWPIRLKAVLAQSRVIAVLVSQHSDEAYYLQEEVAIAVAISRKPNASVRVVPVLLRGADQMHLPYGTFTLHALYEQQGGLSAVATALAQLLKDAPPLQASGAIARTTELLDEIWAGLEPELFDENDRRRPEDFGMRYRSDGEDLVARWRNGGEAQRVTREQLDAKLKPDLLHHVEVLERAMEINKAIWDNRHPRRVLEPQSKQVAEEAARAMAEDLAGVLDTVEAAGMWLDDHYIAIRQIVGQTSGTRST